MPSITTSRPVASTVSTNVDITLEQTSKGVTIFLNGERALRITSEGFLRRYRNLSANAGVRRLDDGRIAIQAAVTA